jgi:hypothetical protein
MSWRFRKTFKVLPGVKLNLTARGLSATLGAAPFSINIGPKGVYRNVSIPGTGIWTGSVLAGLRSHLVSNCRPHSLRSACSDLNPGLALTWHRNT